MYNHIYKKYFSFINFAGYLIILVSLYGFYSDTMDRRLAWALSSFIGGFIVIFKNSKINENKFKGIYFLLDTTIYLGIILLLRSLSLEHMKIGFIIISFVVTINVGIYYFLINTNRITFLGEEKTNN